MMGKKMLKGLLTIIAVIVALVFVEWLIAQPFGQTALYIVIGILFLVQLAAIGVVVYFRGKNAPAAKQNRQNVPEIMRAALNNAAHEKADELHGQVYAVVTRLNEQKRKIWPCFVGATNESLIVSILDSAYSPNAGLLVIPFASLSECTVKRTIIPSQYTVKLCSGKEKCTLRLYSKLPNIPALTQQQANNEALVRELEKRANRIAVKNQ